jgi:hypothetical protein
MSGLMTAGVLACALSGGAAAFTGAAGPHSQDPQHEVGGLAVANAPDAAFEAFLDRLMRAESNGRDTAKNPRSTALGPFQFIKSTFLEVTRRHFPADVARLKEHEILALRTDRGFARRAAEAFSKDNLDYLSDRGLEPTFGDLRLAFLLGPSAAARVLQAEPGKPVSGILGDGVIAANPFMRGMTASDLVARATRDIGGKPPTRAERVARADAAPVPAAVQPAEPTPVAEAETVAVPLPAKVADAAPLPETAEPAPAVQPEEQPARTEAEPRPAPKAVVARSKGTVARPTQREAVINVTCNDKLASCRRWIDQQVAKLLART